MKERRRDPRTKEENKVVLTPIPDSGGRGRGTYYCLAKDISMGGIRIMTDAPLAVDSHINIEITLSKSRTRIQAEARVRWVKELFGKDIFEMGLQFVKIDAAAELALIDHMYGKGKPRT
jgi:c-di-GMP-binding flagellar brake protein YcgR